MVKHTQVDLFPNDHNRAQLSTPRSIHVDVDQLPQAKRFRGLGSIKWSLGVAIICLFAAAVSVPFVITLDVITTTTTTTSTSTTSTTSTSTTSTTTTSTTSTTTTTTTTTTSTTTTSTTSTTTTSTTSTTTTSTTSTTSTTTTSTTSTTTTSTTSTTRTTSTSTTSTSTSTSTTSTTTTTTSTTTSQTTTTTIAACASGYSRSPSGTCVNLQIDFNNCGSFGYVCASSYTSCSAGVCSSAPAVQLVGAIAIPGWGGQYSVDDNYVTLTLPMSLTMYGYSTPTVSVTTNGVLCLGSCSADYTNGNLPSGSFGGPTAFGYWDDLMIYSGTSQSVYYSVAGTAPNRLATFEYYTSHYGQSTQYYHFQILFYENLPGIVKYIYFQASDGGSSATIGVQSSPSGSTMTYSVNQANSVTNNMVLTFDTNAGTYSG
ncbi:unnamed protein product [Rotaria sordida]|uniref:Uncharacterized protein n=1 Tax=Rotaria sordida TaxID=392033 RepID=A0A813ZSR4_9BILA|nr:unnamed protein product [Rotaria sordida]CAF3900443.1 unnamed protein product [Rotaria sordida]